MNTNFDWLEVEIKANCTLEDKPSVMIKIGEDNYAVPLIHDEITIRDKSLMEEFTSSNSGLILFDRNLNKYGYMIW
jgi:hypothetical protein